MTYFVTGLPRSRTAWLAAYLTGCDSFCHHELLKHCTSRAEFYRRAKGVGNSDSGLMITPFQEVFAYAPTVVIERDVDEVRCALGLTHPFIDYCAERLADVRGLRVGFHEIDDRLEEICTHLGLRYRHDLHLVMKDLNVQTMDLEPRPQALNLWVTPSTLEDWSKSSASASTGMPTAPELNSMYTTTSMISGSGLGFSLKTHPWRR